MPESRAQVRYAHAVLSGHGRKKNGMPPALAREIVGKMKGHAMYELPERANTRKKKRKLFGRKHG